MAGFDFKFKDYALEDEGDYKDFLEEDGSEESGAEDDAMVENGGGQAEEKTTYQQFRVNIKFKNVRRYPRFDARRGEKPSLWGEATFNHARQRIAGGRHGGDDIDGGTYIGFEFEFEDDATEGEGYDDDLPEEDQAEEGTASTAEAEEVATKQKVIRRRT